MAEHSSPIAAQRYPLIDVAALDRSLRSSRPPTVLDVRWTLDGPDLAAYRAAHIPGAVFVDLDAELAGPAGAGGRHPLPDLSVLEGLLQRAGVTATSSVVVCGQRDVSVAARAWWLLRWAGIEDVAVLDGGVDAWLAAGLPVESGVGSAPGGGTVVVRGGGMPTVDADEVAALTERGAGVLLDARAAERYRGDLEPVDPVAGHIPGAVNVPLSSIHDASGQLAAPDVLRRVFDDAGARDGTLVVASCGSGVTACALILAGAVIGREFALYPGSYSGWCALGRPVATGDERGGG